MTQFFKYMIAISVATCSMAYAQINNNKVNATLTATANVIGNVDLIIIRDMVVEIVDSTQTELTVDPQSDPRCGEFKIIGSPNSLVRVATDKRSVIRNKTGQSQVYFAGRMAGGTLDIQSQSDLIAPGDEVKLNGEGGFYIWIGGEFTGLEGILSGNYTMALTIAVEYVQ